jgi:osmotically-inducible protein OsmY
LENQKNDEGEDNMIALKKGYDDKSLVRHAERILANDPTIDHSMISVNSRKGVVTISGSVREGFENHHILEVIRRGFDKSGLRYAKIEDATTLR